MKVRMKHQEFEAVFWAGESNCEEVFAFLGWEHSDDEMDHSRIYISTYPNGVLELVPNEAVLTKTIEITPKHWFIKDEKGDVRVYSEEMFRDAFK